MISAIYWLGIVAAVLVNVTALTLLAQRYIPFPATARAAGIVILCLALFALEHFIGLGSLRAAGLPLTALSLYVIWHERAWLRNEVFKADQISFSLRLPLWRRLAIIVTSDRRA